VFWTALNDRRSTENAGMIVRSHAAFGGQAIVIIGQEPWQFKKRAQAFSRHLERLCTFMYLPNEGAFFEWCRSEDIIPVAVEIADPPLFLPGATFPERTALVIGNERTGLGGNFLAKCQRVVTIPQFGPVGCLNAAAAAVVAMYEITRLCDVELSIGGGKYLVDESGDAASQSTSA
jgi:23S rRNA (guanosine2251-2'-O)-methyltransferase